MLHARRRTLALAVTLVAILGVPHAFAVVDSTDAAFSDDTDNASSFHAGDNFGCATTKTVVAVADNHVVEGTPSSNLGSTASARVRSQSANDARTLVRFLLPAIGDECMLTGATLRLNAVSSSAGRTIQALRVAASWTETGSTWTNQPATTGAAATAPSALGWVTWNVLSQTQAMYAASNHGFLLRDAVEDSATARLQEYSTREGANAPELVLTFGDLVVCTPGIQTVTADADAYVYQASASSNFGTGASFYVYSNGTQNARALVGFPLPALGGCEVTAATLRLNATAAASGRTLQVFRAAATWTETGATWNNQPATTGTAVTTTSAVGWREWPVTALVQAMYAGTNSGFVVRDATEGGSNLLQTFSSRETANPPELVLTIGALAMTPDAPTDLSATAVSTSAIDLTWTDNAIDEDGFRIERSAGGENSWFQIATVGPDVTSYADTGLAGATTYYYRVKAYNEGGNSAVSNTASATTHTPPVPNPPTNLSASAVSGARIDLAWTDNATDEDGFRIERSPGGAGTWTQIATVPGNVVTYADTGLSPSTSYDYRVRAANGGVTSAYSNTASATTLVCPSPGTQTLTAAADSYVYQAQPTTNGGTATSTYVMSSTGANLRTLVTFALPSVPTGCSLTGATLRLNATGTAAGRTLQALRAAAAWTETGVTWNTQPATTGTAATTTSALGWREWTVTDHVKAMYSGANHGFLLKDASENAGSAQLQTYSSREGTNPPQLLLTFGEPPPPPAAPTALAATATSSSQIDLTWTDNATSETGFVIERSPGGTGTWTEIASVAADVTAYASTGLSGATTYDYRVRAQNEGGPSAWSNIASATTGAPPPPPDAPTGLSASGVSATQIDLTWSDNATTEDGFRIERSPGGADTWTEVGSVGADMTGYADSGLSAGTPYDYRVTAYNGGGPSASSNVASATTLTCTAPGSQTVQAEADAFVNQFYSTTNFGTDVTLRVDSYQTYNSRSYVRFSLPVVPAGCTVTGATLRVNATAAAGGRTIEVAAAAAAWTESAITWANQPGSTGTAVMLPSAIGWREWDVDDILVTMYGGSNHGFVLRDASEGSATQLTQEYSSREGANRPELVVTFG